MKRHRLPRAFFARPTLRVASDLLGKVLLRRTGNTTHAGRILEVEAYRGEDDLACHAARGRTPRTETLYARPGTAYVYLIYGLHHCLNIVTEREGYPAAVLIRSCAPLLGGRRGMNGPGRLCRTLRITRALNGSDVCAGQDLRLEDDGYAVRSRDIKRTPRVGVEYAGASARWPRRFVLHYPRK